MTKAIKWTHVVTYTYIYRRGGVFHLFYDHEHLSSEALCGTRGHPRRVRPKGRLCRSCKKARRKKK